MAKNNNLTDFLTDVADAIRAKKGTYAPINPQDFFTEIASIGTGGATIPGRPEWTGHADVEGLKSIGWTDGDIAYYQENGVNWNEEDDHLHLVSDDNKALYGVLTADNISTYASRIVYLPKIDTGGMTSMRRMFYGCHSLVSIPQLDTQKVTNMNQMFSGCSSLVYVPLLNTANVTDMGNMFLTCRSLVSIPQLNTINVTNMYSMFAYCLSLVNVPQLDMQSLTSDIGNMFLSCFSLTHINIKNVKVACYFRDSTLLSKESLLYIINNEAATSAITIGLTQYAYSRLGNDADIVAALAAHPNVSLS
mgnify:CR=1 FL=1